MKTLFLIDANSLIHRAYHALPPMSGPGGEPTNALYGVSRILMKIWREERPDYAAALFDRPEPTFRDKIYKEYKGTRPETPDTLISQLIEAHNLFSVFGIKTFEEAGYEADDLIATFAEKFKNEEGIRVIIFTGDLDSLQLVEEGKISVRVPQKGISETTIYTPEAVKERYDLYPKDLPDYKALVGDNSDNIRGVPGIGPKTAAKLIQRYGTVEKLFASLPEDAALSEKFAKYEKQAFLAKELVLLKRDAPVPLDAIAELQTKEDQEAQIKYFASKGFSSLVRQVSGEEPVEKPEKNKKKEVQNPAQGSLL